MGTLTDRLKTNPSILRTYQHMIRNAPIGVVKELKQNLEQEPEYLSARQKPNLDEEFIKRFKIEEQQ